jgi:hypothetical protein
VCGVESGRLFCVLQNFDDHFELRFRCFVTFFFFIFFFSESKSLCCRQFDVRLLLPTVTHRHRRCLAIWTWHKLFDDRELGKLCAENLPRTPEYLHKGGCALVTTPVCCVHRPCLLCSATSHAALEDSNRAARCH